MPTTYQAIATTTVGAGGISNIDFQNIPSTYTDLLFKLCLRGNLVNTETFVQIEFNGLSTNRSGKLLVATGTAIGSYTYASNMFTYCNGTQTTSSTFSAVDVYIPGYAGTQNKSFYIDGAGSENNGTGANNHLFSALWGVSSAITRVTFYAADSDLVKNKTFNQYSTITMYGIKKN